MRYPEIFKAFSNGFVARNGNQLVKVNNPKFEHSVGCCFTVPLPDVPAGDSDGRPGQSMLRVFENGIELGPGHSRHKDIEDIGRGRFSHWGKILYLSTANGSSPVTNRSVYHVLWDDFRAQCDELPVASLPLGVLLNLQQGTMSYQYKGIDCFKCPFDLALYQRLLWELRPRTIIEIGTWKGGSALWFADLLVTYGIDGHVHSFDIADPPKLVHDRITFHRADAMDISEVVPASLVATLNRPLLVIEDAGHYASLTLAVLKHFGPLLEKGEYLVVEDAIIHEMGVAHDYDGGPRQAIREFLKSNTQYVIDRKYCDLYGENVTWNVNGYLRRI